MKIQEFDFIITLDVFCNIGLRQVTVPKENILLKGD